MARLTSIAKGGYYPFPAEHLPAVASLFQPAQRGGLALDPVGGRAIGFFPACLSAGVVLAVVLVITHPLEGLALYAFALRSLRGLATLAAIQRRAGLMALVGKAMQVTPQEGMLQADDVYEPVWEDDEDEGNEMLGGEWEYLGGFGDARGEGLSIVENPFALKGRRDGGDE